MVDFHVLVDEARALNNIGINTVGLPSLYSDNYLISFVSLEMYTTISNQKLGSYNASGA